MAGNRGAASEPAVAKAWATWEWSASGGHRERPISRHWKRIRELPITDKVL